MRDFTVLPFEIFFKWNANESRWNCQKPTSYTLRSRTHKKKGNSENLFPNKERNYNEFD